MFALITLLGFQAIIKQICFLFPSFPQAPLFPSVSSCSSQNSRGFSSTIISFPSSHFLQIGLLANPVNILSIFPLLSASHWWELTALSQATLAELLGSTSLPLPDELFGLSEGSRRTNSSKRAVVFLCGVALPWHALLCALEAVSRDWLCLEEIKVSPSEVLGNASEMLE